MVADDPEVRAFLNAAVRWCRSGAPAELETLLRSWCSGVPHDVGAAYATVAARTGSLLDAIDAGTLTLPSADRDAVLTFAQRVRRMSTLAESMDDEALSAGIIAEFALQGRDDVVRRADRDKEIALAEPLEREAPGRVFGRAKHFSASALNAYVECERKWFYRYACGAIEDRGSSASAYGTAFHLALEDFHGEFDRPRASDEAAMRARIAECITWAFARNRDGFETHVEFELQMRRAQRTAARYVDWIVARARRAPFTVIGREVPVAIDLGDHPFVGFIDRLDRDERSGAVGVVDYKTGSIATSAAEYRDKVRRSDDFQLPFYYWARTMAGDRVGTLELVPLKDARLDVRPIVIEVDREVVGELERARRRMIEVGDDLAAGRERSFRVATDPDACTFCAYATACAGKPSPKPERFGR